MLIGSVSHAIDAKGRYMVPSKFRSDLGNQFVVTKGDGCCLFVFTLEQWELISKELAQRPAADGETVRRKRDFFSTAFDVELDKQFRIVLPPSLRQVAALDRDVVSVGMVNRLEIWDKTNWEAYCAGQLELADQQTSILSGVVL